MARKRRECYPDFSAELDAIRAGGITSEIIARIIRKHRGNSGFNEKLCERYQAIEEGVPIFKRHPRFEKGVQLNNRLNNDFFSEIVDFKTGYFAGKPIAYSYSSTKESERVSGSEADVTRAGKALTDFVVYANMYDVDMQCVKYAAICGYGARLFYIDKNGRENVMSVLPYQVILLSDTDITAPEYGIRYYKTRDIHDAVVCKAEFYDGQYVYSYAGGSFDKLVLAKDPEPHLFGQCPLQGIPNNEEMIGDAEKVLSLIDAYDRSMSDSSNEIENFAQAYMVFKNIPVSEEQMAQSQQSGAIQFFTSDTNADVYYLTKNVNDTFLQNYHDRLEDNIYHFSKTPNISDESFGTSSGVSLKYKLAELETKCGMLQAKIQAAGTYMFQLLSRSFEKRLHINMIPEQCVMEFKRNFPLDTLSEAQAAQAMIASGLPKRVVYGNAYSFVDDVEYVMDLIAEEEGDTISLYTPDEPEA